MNSPDKISHIGIAVKQLEKHLPFYQEVLGLKLEKIETIEIEKVRVAFLIIGNARIELLEPLNNQSTIQKYIEKHGEGIHHIAIEVDQLDERLKRMKKEGIQLLNDKPLPGALGSERSFIHPKSAGGVLFELVQFHTH